jgi:hypothetical protein
MYLAIYISNSLSIYLSIYQSISLVEDSCLEEIEARGYQGIDLSIYLSIYLSNYKFLISY